MLKSIFKSKLAQNGVWMLALQFFSTIMPILTLPYITRVLSKSAYGELSVALSYMTYFQVFVEYGFKLSGAKKTAMKNNVNEIDYICGNIFFSRLLLVVFCFIALAFFALFAPVKRSLVICMFILFSMVISLVFQQNWFFQGISEMKNITIVNVTGRVLAIVLIFIFVKQPEDLYLYCAINAFGNVISSLLGFVIAQKKYNLKVKYNGFKAIVKELKDGWPLFVSTAMGSLFGSVGVTMLGFFETSEVVGVYSAVSKIPYVLNMIFFAFSQALYPTFCRGYSNSFNEGIKLLKKYGIPIVALFIFCGLFIIFFRRPIVLLAFGDEYISGLPLLIPFTIWTILGIINNFLGIQTLVASGYDKEYSRAFVISIITMLLLMVVLGKNMGAIGVALASMFSEALLTLLLIKYVLCMKG